MHSGEKKKKSSSQSVIERIQFDEEKVKKSEYEPRVYPAMVRGSSPR